MDSAKNITSVLPNLSCTLLWYTRHVVLQGGQFEFPLHNVNRKLSLKQLVGCLSLYSIKKVKCELRNPRLTFLATLLQQQSFEHAVKQVHIYFFKITSAMAVSNLRLASVWSLPDTFIK